MALLSDLAPDPPAAARPSIVWLANWCCLAAVVALLPLVRAPDPVELTLGLAGQVVVAIALTLYARRVRPARPPRRSASIAGIALYLISAFLLRDAGGPASGYGSLALMPVVWAALEAEEVALSVAVGGLVLFFFLPSLLVGGSLYPITGLRSGVLLAIIAGALAIAARRLIVAVEERRRRDEHDVRALTAIGRVARTLSGADPAAARSMICQVAAEVAAASQAAIWEPAADGELHAVGLPGARPVVMLKPGSARERAVRDVLATGTPSFVAGIENADGVSAAHFQPVPGRSATRAVLALEWRTPEPKIPPELPALLEILADETAVALDRLESLALLESLARTDDLTGLPNRRAWTEMLEREMRIARRTGQPLALVLIDLDRFKQYNDRYGHLAGDKHLIAVTQAWHAVLRETDVLARWAGDEFSLLLPACDGFAAEVLVERLRRATPDVSFSSGIATTAEQDTLDALTSAADVALYASKRATATA